MCDANAFVLLTETSVAMSTTGMLPKRTGLFILIHIYSSNSIFFIIMQ